jgi:2-C-methyl-D-erythritol 2,4-cyclodiphosphate synthase
VSDQTASRTEREEGQQREKVQAPLPLGADSVAPSSLQSQLQTCRVGFGYDSHRFAPGGPLRLGGVNIPDGRSLEGHSDGDAVAHAITDAVLGAAGAGDIGAMFPDDDPANLGRDSVGMLARAVTVARGLGWVVGNVDVTVVAESPRIGPHRDAMREALAPALGIAIRDINIKGKSNEGMGWLGRGEGIACFAVAMLAPVQSA